MNVFYVSIRATENYEFDKIRTTGVTENATNYKNSQGDNSKCSTRHGRRQRGASGARPPHMKSVPPLFHVWLAAYIQYCIFKMWPPLLVFWPSICFLARPAAKFWRQACNQRLNFAALPANFTTSRHCSNGWARVKSERTYSREPLLRTIFFDSRHLQIARGRPTWNENIWTLTMPNGKSQS